MTENFYWDRIKGYPTELQIDARWLLRKPDDEKTYGSLRIVSHPDLKPGHLRAHLQIVKGITDKTRNEILQTIHDYKINEIEMEVYSIKDNYEVDYSEIVDTKKQLEELFQVKIFE